MKSFPICISSNCDLADKCVRKIDGEESKKVDYLKVDMGMNDVCVWFIEMKGEVEVSEEDS